jgi:hypothetical protein|tara:strand:- start:273 stop:512 length:240 start_codon:yes stop_codon:yes gene_type:complete
LDKKSIKIMENNAIFMEWVNDGNVEKIDTDKYVEQTTQWKKIFTWKELKEFYIKEFIEDYNEMGETCRNGKTWSKCKCC